MTQPPESIFQRTSSSSTSAVAATQNPSRALAQSTSTLATAVTQLSNNPISHSPSSINHQSSSSFNNDYPPTQLLHLPLNAVTHNISSMDYQTSSSSSSNSNPSHILPSDSSLIDHPPGQIFPATTPTVVPGPSATQAIIPEATASSAVGLANTTLAGTGILPLEESATPDKVANAAIESVGNGVEIVQTLPTTAFIVFTIPLVPAAADSSVELIVPISASMGIVPPGTSAASVTPAKSTIQSGGNGSSAVTGSGSTTGSGNPTESVSGHTTVPIVSTGEAKGVTRWENWWLEFGILVWGVGMVYWV